MNATTKLTKIDKNTYAFGTGAKVNISNTDWAVEHIIRRSGSGWTVARRVVNGICQGGSVQFKSLKSAIESCE